MGKVYGIKKSFVAHRDLQRLALRQDSQGHESRDQPARYQSRGISIDRPWVLTAQLPPHRFMPNRIHD